MTLTAIPSEGCEFDKWYGDIDDNLTNSSTISVVMNTDRTVVASFTGCPGLLDITINASLYSSGSDTLNASFGYLTWSTVYTTEGTRVDVTAAAAEGYRFDRWLGAINGSQESMSFIANSSESITARFSEASSSIWTWAMIGVIMVLLLGALYYMIKSGRKKRPQEAQTDAAVPPQQP